MLSVACLPRTQSALTSVDDDVSHVCCLGDMSEQKPPLRLRLDIWLNVACICKTRSTAQRACRGGKVSVNGTRAKPHSQIGKGDRIAITSPNGQKRQFIVTTLMEHPIRKSDARALYDDITPPPSQAEIELRDLLRRAGPRRRTKQSSPNRRERRFRRTAKEHI
jgi:ribosome-associated heat shock protein Hsp15